MAWPAHAALRFLLRPAVRHSHPTECGSAPASRSCFSPFAVDEPKQLGARAVQRVGVDVNAIDAVCQSSKSQAIRKPVREIVRPQLEPQPRGDEVKVKARVAEVRNAAPELVER